MFINKTRSLNCEKLVLGNAFTPSAGTIDISSSSSAHPISINGIIPTGAAPTDSIETIDIKGGASSMGCYGYYYKNICCTRTTSNRW